MPPTRSPDAGSTTALQVVPSTYPSAVAGTRNTAQPPRTPPLRESRPFSMPTSFREARPDSGRPEGDPPAGCPKTASTGCYRHWVRSEPRALPSAHGSRRAEHAGGAARQDPPHLKPRGRRGQSRGWSTRPTSAPGGPLPIQKILPGAAELARSLLREAASIPQPARVADEGAAGDSGRDGQPSMALSFRTAARCQGPLSDRPAGPGEQPDSVFDPLDAADLAAGEGGEWPAGRSISVRRARDRARHECRGARRIRRGRAAGRRILGTSMLARRRRFAC